MKNSHDKYETFKPLKDAYDLKKNEWNAALRVNQHGTNEMIKNIVNFVLP